MDQDIEIINQNTRIEKLKNFFFSNLKKIIIFLLILVLIVFGNFIFLDIKKKNKIKIAETFNQVTALYNIGDQQDTKKKPFWKKPLLITKKTVEQDPNDKDIQWVTLDLYNPYEDVDSSNKTLN